MNDFLNYLSGYNSVASAAQPSGGDFWSSLGSAMGRSSAMGGGLTGLGAALDPNFYNSYATAAGNKPLQKPMAANQQSQGNNSSMSSLALGNPGTHLSL